MKAIILFIFFIFLAVPPVFGQIKIGDNPQNIDASSVLELESSSKVLVITRVNTLEMEAITPQRGGLVYNTDTECVNYYDGTQWVNLCDAVNFTITNDPIINGRSTIEITESAAGYNLEIAKNSILGDNIIDGGIGPDDIQDNSLTQDKLAEASVGSSEIRQNAVGSDEIRDGSIAPEDMANTIADQVLTTDENGIVQWEDANDLFDLTFDTLDNTLTISRSTTPGVSTISLEALVGSDDQQLTLENNILTLQDGGTPIDLSTYTNTGTDEQTIATNGTAGNITILNGNEITLNVDDADANASNELQNIEEVLSDGNDAGGIRIENIGAPVDINDAATKAYVDTEIADVVTSGGSDPVNEQNTAFDVVGGELIITDIAGTLSVPLTSIDTDTQLTDAEIAAFGYLKNGEIPLNQGNILIGSNANVAEQGFISGDATMNDQGLLTIENEAVTPLKIEPGLDGQYLSTVGGAVTWVAAPGGTGGSTEVADGTTISGDGTAATPFTITPGANGEFLSTNVDGDVIWATPPGATGGSTEVADGTTISGDGTPGNPFTIEPGTDGQFLSTVGGNVAWTTAPNTTGTTNISEGTNITITGDGSLGSPYVINATGTTGSAWTDITGIPVGFADDIDNDTQYTAGTGLTLTGTEFALNAGTIVADWSNLTGIPANLDLDSTDDFDSEWTSLNNIPADIADGDNDTQYTAGTGLTLTGTEFALNAGTIVADWSNLTGIPANLDLDSTDDFDGEWTSLNNIPADIADGDNDTQYTAGTGLTLTGTEFALGTISGGPSGNIATNSITQGDIDFDAIGAGEIQANAVGLSEMKDNSVGSDEIIDGSITNADIGTGIEGVKILPNFGGQLIQTTGNVQANTFISATNTYPDYVFQKYFLGNSSIKADYEFTSLEIVETFIKENHHLPGVKSVSEIEANDGNWNLSEGALVNLEKIEELFLHTIEQEKKIKELQKANTSMSSEIEALKTQMEEIKTMLLEKQND